MVDYLGILGMSTLCLCPAVTCTRVGCTMFRYSGNGPCRLHISFPCAAGPRPHRPISVPRSPLACGSPQQSSRDQGPARLFGKQPKSTSTQPTTPDSAACRHAVVDCSMLYPLDRAGCLQCKATGFPVLTTPNPSSPALPSSSRHPSSRCYLMSTQAWLYGEPYLQTFPGPSRQWH